MEIATVEEAPTIQSFIPAKPSSEKRPSGTSTEMDIDCIQSIDALTDAQKHIIHTTIGEVLDGKPYSNVSDLAHALKAKDIVMSMECVTSYVKWIADTYEAMPHLHLPQILYDPESQEFFDVS